MTLMSKDRVGNPSPLRWVRVKVDGKPPQVTFLLEPLQVEGDDGKLWIPPSSKATAESTDDTAGVKDLTLTTNGQVQKVQDAVLTSNLPKLGAVHLEAVSSDKVGNTCVPKEMTVHIDSEPPVTRLSLEGQQYQRGATLFANTEMKLTCQVTDAQSGVTDWKAVVDGATGNSREIPKTWAEGPHQVSITATDRVGNTSTSQPLSFSVDATGPVISWEVLGESVLNSKGERWYKGKTTINARGQDSGAGLQNLQWSANGSQWETFQPNLEVVGNQLNFRGQDRVGNVTLETAQWNVDGQAPRVVLTLPNGDQPKPGETIYIASGEQLSMEAIDDGSGLKSASCQTGKSAWFPMPKQIKFSGMDLHRSDLTVACEDLLGNRSSFTWLLRIDKKLDRGQK